MNSAPQQATAGDDWLYSLRPGRSLRFSPDWDCSDATVVFDSNSGDYWVLAELAGLAVKALQVQGQTGVQALARALDGATHAPSIYAALEQALQSLVDNGLVQSAQR